MRGNRRPGREAETVSGSIPACAGEPAPDPGTGPQDVVYPRVCGGTELHYATHDGSTGLSPRVRGNPGTAPHPGGALWSIPACAGEPISVSCSSRLPAVYPRVCGGTISAGSPATNAAGLSPRVRGNPVRPHILRSVRRSIPACAGEPIPGCVSVIISTVYPRVCGGTPAGGEHQDVGMGLSPRVRGNRTDNGNPPPSLRSIPACAGEPNPAYAPSAAGAVYPRVCGGTRPSRRSVPPVQGLSPRVRGNRQRRPKRDIALGSIPACAGEPARRGLKIISHRVYPRVCGGTLYCGAGGATLGGLSPRVRGNLSASARSAVCFRSIPACAGEPQPR